MPPRIESQEEVRELAPKKQVDHRDAGSGRFVTKKYADKHKPTTVKETRKKG